MPDHIKQIIQAAVLAPSGENSQPWKFVVKDNFIYLYNVPERDLSFYNFKQYGSYVAHGAAIENILITASYLGYKCLIDLFPNTEDENLVASIKLERSNPSEDPLFSSIPKRVSNRKAYRVVPLENEQREALFSSVRNISGVKFYLIEDKEAIKQLALVGSTNERIMLEARQVHDFFFDHLNWTEKEELEKRYGFYIKTLELPPPIVIAFKLFKHWPVMRFLNLIGFTKLVEKGNADLYATASAFGIIAIDNAQPKNFVLAGRATQRIWLMATKLGLGFQPLTGILFFMQKISGAEDKDFSQKHVELIKSRYETVRSTFKLEQGTVAMMFRIGTADPPSARSNRLPFEKFIDSN